MTRRLTLSLLLLLLPLALLVGCGPKEGAGGDAADETLEGVVAMPEEGSPFIAFNLWFQVGSQHDPDGKEGLAAITAEMLADASTQQDSYQEILEKLYPMATGYGSSVDKEMTVFRGVVHRDNLEAFYELFSQAILQPAFTQEDFDRIKSQWVNYVERGRRFQRDEELSKELLFWMAYRGTPYEHPEEGYVQSVKSITLDDVKQFYADHYRRGSVVVGVGGGYPDGFPARVRADFDALPEGTAPAVVAPQPQMPDGVKVLLVEKDTDASAISFGFPIDVVRGDEDFWELYLAATWLGEHRSSVGQLYQVIRERRGMNYGDYAYVEAFPRGYTTQERPVNYSRRSQLMEVWIRPISETAPGNLHDRTLFATRAGWRELEKMVSGGLPLAEVERAKEYLYNFSVTYGSTIGRRLAYAIDDAFYGLPEPGFLGSIRPALETISVESLGEALAEHLQSENMYLVIITEDAEALKAKLISGEATPITYAGEQPPSILEEDQEIAVYPIPVEEDDFVILDIMEVFEG